MKPLFTAERRACMVQHREGKEMKEKRAIFHLFATKACPIEPSPLRGGHPGGQYSEPVAVVEYEDGTVHMVDPLCVRFLDTKELMEQHVRDEKPYYTTKYLGRWVSKEGTPTTRPTSASPSGPERDCLTCEYNENGKNRPCSDCKDFNKWEAPRNE